jgi:hypothetical protein
MVLIFQICKQKDEADIIIPIESILEYSNIYLGSTICSAPDAGFVLLPSMWNCAL